MTDTLIRPAAPAAASVPPERRARKASPRIGSHVFLMLLLIGFLAPVVWAIVSSFKQPNDIIRDPLGFDVTTFTLDNFTRVLTSRDFVDALITTLTYSLVGTALAIGLGLAAALIVRSPFHGVRAPLPTSARMGTDGRTVSPGFRAGR